MPSTLYVQMHLRIHVHTRKAEGITSSYWLSLSLALLLLATFVHVDTCAGKSRSILEKGKKGRSSFTHSLKSQVKSTHKTLQLTTVCQK